MFNYGHQVYVVLIFGLIIALCFAFAKKDISNSSNTVRLWPLNDTLKSIIWNDIGNNEFSYVWTPYPGATSYFAEAFANPGYDPKLRLPSDPELGGPTLELSSNQTEVISNNALTYLQITARTPNGNTIIQIAPCFLAGSMVQMADGTQKKIEDVCIGDMVLGAFGEHNEILALHRPLLGSFKLCKINGEHTTTNHHPHVGSDKGFYCGDPDLVSAATYNKSHTVIGKEGTEEMFLSGLASYRIRQMTIGSSLMMYQGPVEVFSMEIIEMPEDTQLYNLVVGNSHTYFVENYAVTGWPREDDFDYDTWQPKVDEAGTAYLST